MTGTDKVRAALNHYADQADDLGDTLTAQAVHRWHSVVSLRLLEAIEESNSAGEADDAEAEAEVEAIAAVLAAGAALGLALENSAEQLPDSVLEPAKVWGRSMQMLARAFPGLLEELAKFAEEADDDDDQADDDPADVLSALTTNPVNGAAA